MSPVILGFYIQTTDNPNYFKLNKAVLTRLTLSDGLQVYDISSSEKRIKEFLSGINEKFLGWVSTSEEHKFDELVDKVFPFKNSEYSENSFQKFKEVELPNDKFLVISFETLQDINGLDLNIDVMIQKASKLLE